MQLRAMESSKVRWVCLATLAVAFLAGDLVAAAEKRYDWDVNYMYGKPDCVTKAIIGINNQFPGPKITAVVGDTILVNLTNSMPTEGVTIHWHGIRQKGTPWADGTALFSQCAINPGESFLYKFTVDQPGTFFYHGHYGCQRAAGLYGSLIVNLNNATDHEPYNYDSEFSIIVSDWWHASIYEQENELHSTAKFNWVGAPQSLLIEGRGRYDCSAIAGRDLPCEQTAPECAPLVLPVEFNKTYRLRIASSASLAPLNIQLEDHTMTVVEADAHNVEPFETDNLYVYTGETYSVLFTANQLPTRNYWLALNERGRPHDEVPTAVAILQYVNPTNKMSVLPTTVPPQGPANNDTSVNKDQATKYKAKAGYNISVPAATRTLNLLTLQAMYKLQNRWSINNVSYNLPQTPVLASLVYNISDAFDTRIPPDSYTGSPDIYNKPANNESEVGSGAYMFQLGEVVDIIIQNANTLLDNVSEIHPWHLHGHDFWVLGYGTGLFNHAQDSSHFNTINPPMKQTVVVFPYGWTAIRFVADNPGVWPFHCHVEWHFELGMGVVFAVGIANVSKIDFPKETMGCGLSKPIFSP